MERQRDEDARKAPSATAPGASLLHRTGCLAPGAALQLAVTHRAFGSGQHHPLTLTNTWSWGYSQRSECPGLHLMPRATVLTAHHCPGPHAPLASKAGGWQVQGTSVLLGGQEDCAQPQQSLLSAPEPLVCFQLISSATQPHFMVYWDTARSRILSATWHSGTLVQGG